MHFVFLNQYYPPDAAPTGVMLELVVQRLLEAGHEVTVLCADGGYAADSHAVGSGGHRSTWSNRTAERDWSGAAGAAVGVPPKGAPRVLRIGATKFGRGSFIGKLLDYGSYYFGVAWRLARLQPRPERIVALTTPPYLSVLARMMSKFRGADHAHWVMDVYPDVMTAHGMLGKHGLWHDVLTAAAKWGMGGRRRAAVLTLGPDMAERLVKTTAGGGEAVEWTDGAAGGHAAVVHWVPLWGADAAEEPVGDRQEAVRSLRRERGWADDELVVMYSGNMGLGHRFGEICEVMRRLTGMADRDEHGMPIPPAVLPDTMAKTRFAFFGGGKRRQELEEFRQSFPRPVFELHDYVPRGRLRDHLRSGDVHLVSLAPAWTGTMLPSKLQGIFAVERPVIFIGDPKSSLARWVRESGGGWVVPPGAVDQLAAALEEARDPVMRQRRGQAAGGFAAAHFCGRRNSERVAACLARC